MKSAEAAYSHKRQTAFHSTVHVLTWPNDADCLCDGLGSDGVVSSDHDHFDPSGAALLHCLRHVGAGRVDEGDETNEAEVFQREVHLCAV